MITTRGTRRLCAPLVVLFALMGAALQASADQKVGPGVWFLRVTNPKGARAALCARLYFNPNLTPWYGDTLFVAHGAAEKAAPAAQAWLRPGQSTEWIDIGAHMSSNPTFWGSRDYLAPVFVGAKTEPEQKRLWLRVEIARGAERTPVRAITAKEDQPAMLGDSTWLGGAPLPTLGLLIPASPASKERIWTLEEAAAQQLRWIASYGPTPTPSTHVWFISHQSPVRLTNPSRLAGMQAEIVRRLGYANLTQYASDEADLQAIRAMGAAPAQTVVADTAADLRARAEALKRSGLWPYTRVVTFGDEVDVDLKMSPAEQNAAFVAELQRRGEGPDPYLRPEDANAAAALPEAERWARVRIQGALPADRPRLLYEAAVFRYRLWTREMAAQTAVVKEVFPPGVQTGANLSPHLSVWPDVRKWIDVARDGGLTMPWSEDWWWQVPEASPQTYGYLLDALRHASDYHNAPYCFYTIPDNGERAVDLLRMGYFALGHQARVIDHFAIYHQAFGTCDYIDFLESRDKFRSIHRILTDVGRIDARLAAARCRPAEIAIVLSLPNDVWNTEDLLTDPAQKNGTGLYSATLNADNHERKALWLALRHAQYPVDLITDEDVAAGALARYKVAYVVGRELLADAVEPLRRWVEAGGVLVGEAGGGMWNQYREPQAAMTALYGLADSPIRQPVRGLGPATDLPKMAPLDTVRFAGVDGTLPALCTRQALRPQGSTRAIATYADGSPAATDRAVGRGHAVCYGSMAGVAYLRPAMADKQAAGRKQPLPHAFPAALRALIAAPAERSGVTRPVMISDPLVEGTLQEGPEGAIVTLTSFRPTEGKAVRVSLPGLPDAHRVTSVRRGALRVDRSHGAPAVTLPLDVGDFLLVDR